MEKYPEILFEDNHLLVAVKPAGILSQSDTTGAPDMLTLLKAYLVEKYKKPGEAYLGLLHRLDRPVCGVMVFAKTSKCASRISEQIRNRTVKKKYRAVVYGAFEEKKGEVRSYLLKNSKTNLVDVFQNRAETQRSALWTTKSLEREGSQGSRYRFFRSIFTRGGLIRSVPSSRRSDIRSSETVNTGKDRTGFPGISFFSPTILRWTIP